MAEAREETDEESDGDDSLRYLRMPGAFHTFFSTDTVQVASSSALPSTVHTESPSPETERTGASTPTRSPTPVLAFDPEPVAEQVEDHEPPPTKRVQRPKTCMRFAHPPPPTRPLGKKGIIRPRVLLQLQQRSGSGFHKPIYDVLPASRFAPVTKIGQKLQCLRKDRDGLAADDLVVLKAEDYKTSDTHSEDIDISDARDVLGIISSIPGDPDSAMISLENGTWKATSGLKGFYTFVLQGEHPQTARWYIPIAKRKSVPAEKQEARKFYFANMDPNTKKHPAIASMTASNMEIYDEYVKTSEPEEIIATDGVLRKLIIVSGSWLFFREGWSSNYKFDACLRPPQHRAASMPVETMRRQSAFGVSPARSPARPVIDENPADSVGGGNRRFRLTPPIPSASPSLKNVAETPVHSGSNSFRNSDQITAPSDGANTAEQSPEPSRAALPLSRAATDIDVISQKRRSWNGHELPSFSWQSAKGSLSRRLSSKGPKNVTFIDGETTVTFKPNAPSHIEKSSRSMRHLRRMSQSIRGSATEKMDAKTVDFHEIKFGTVSEAQPLPQMDGSTMASTESLAPSATASEYVDSAEEQSAPEEKTTSPESTPATSQGATTESSVHTASIHQEDLEAFTTSNALDKSESFRSLNLPVTPRKPSLLGEHPMESTDNLISAVKYTYWQQYDRLLERQMSPTPRTLPVIAHSTVATDNQVADLVRDTLPLPPNTPVASSKSPVSVGLVERKTTWKEKLKYKLHV